MLEKKNLRIFVCELHTVNLSDQNRTNPIEYVRKTVINKEKSVANFPVQTQRLNLKRKC